MPIITGARLMIKKHHRGNGSITGSALTPLAKAIKMGKMTMMVDLRIEVTEPTRLPGLVEALTSSNLPSLEILDLGVMLDSDGRIGEQTVGAQCDVE